MAILLYAFDKYKNKVVFNGDISIPIPMQLPDGSILFYDRGNEYGEYELDINNGLKRLDGAVDDGSAGSLNWRYLICDSANLSEDRAWGPSKEEGTTNATVGAGLPNTETLLSKYSDNSSYIWQLVQNKRNATGGKKWFVPSKDEMNIVYQNKDTIVNAGGSSFLTDFYWTSTEYGRMQSYYQQFLINGGGGMIFKSNTYYCRLLRRI